MGNEVNGIPKLPAPPYYAVIFANQRTAQDDEGYGKAAERMVELAETMPGYLGMESTRNAAGYGITVSYWESEDAIKNWKAHAEHAEARRQGRENWYEHFVLRVAKVERAYSFEKKSSFAEASED